MTVSAVAGGWGVHLPTVDETCVRVRSASPAGSAPWPIARALVELRAQGLETSARFRSLGAGRGRPLLHAQEAEWWGLAAHLEAITDRSGAAEVALALPSMDAITAAGVDEAAWWHLVDGFCAAVDAEHGAVVDGEPVALEAPAEGEGWRRRLGNHIGLLVPDHLSIDWGACGVAYTHLPLSHLTVVLR